GLRMYTAQLVKWHLINLGFPKDVHSIYFHGNEEAYETRVNTFFPPVIGRFIRLHPITWNNAATIRMEFYGCELDGIVTQGAKSMSKEMYVIKYALQYSDNGIDWTYYTDDDDVPVKMFDGNTNNNDHMKNYIYPPIFSRFIRIVPKRWWNSITMRVELLGCDFE
ncbi:hypothetical protein XENOCAPTIV_029272, partial [Xenoophorus captivus]